MDMVIELIKANESCCRAMELELDGRCHPFMTSTATSTNTTKITTPSSTSPFDQAKEEKTN